MQRDLEGRKAAEYKQAFSSMTECHDRIMEQGNYDEETAWAVCQSIMGGKVTAASGASSGAGAGAAAQPFEDKAGRLFLKIFLLDGSVNLNSWGVEPSSIERNIFSAIGKPVVMFKNGQGEYDHPPIQSQDSVDHALAYQDLYKIGTYVDVVESPTKKGEWWGIAEITDDGVRKAIREDPNIPFYVSPTIRLTQPIQNEHALTDWSFMHSAIVDKPAYTIKKAYISGQCNGNSDTCLLQLRKASIASNNGELGCGFCTYKAAKQIQQNVSNYLSSLSANKQQILNRANIMANDNISREATNSPTSTSAATTTTPTPTIAEQPTQVPQQPVQQQQQAPQTQKVEEAEKKKQLNKQKEDQSVPTEKKEAEQQNVAGAQELLETVQRLSTKNKELELQLQTAKADKDSLQALNTQFNERLARIEQERDEERMASRKTAITERLTRSPVYQNMPADERQKWIDNYIQGTSTIQQINEQLGSLEASFKKASLGGYASASYTPRLSLGGANNNTKSVAVGETRSASKEVNDEQPPAHLRLHQHYARPTPSGGIE